MIDHHQYAAKAAAEQAVGLALGNIADRGFDSSLQAAPIESITVSTGSLRSLVEFLEHLGDRLLGATPQAGGSVSGKMHEPNSVVEKLEAVQVLNSALLRRGHEAASRLDAGIREITDRL